MVKVEFTSNYASFKSGDVVALETSKAKRYIALSIAKFHSECDTKPTTEKRVEEEVKKSVQESKPQNKKHNRN